MRALGGVKLLILDDWGSSRSVPSTITICVEDRYGRGATLIPASSLRTAGME